MRASVVCIGLLCCLAVSVVAEKYSTISTQLHEQKKPKIPFDKLKSILQKVPRKVSDHLKPPASDDLIDQAPAHPVKKFETKVGYSVKPQSHRERALLKPEGFGTEQGSGGLATTTTTTQQKSTNLIKATVNKKTQTVDKAQNMLSQADKLIQQALTLKLKSAKSQTKSTTTSKPEPQQKKETATTPEAADQTDKSKTQDKAATPVKADKAAPTKENADVAKQDTSAGDKTADQKKSVFPQAVKPDQAGPVNEKKKAQGKETEAKGKESSKKAKEASKKADLAGSVAAKEGLNAKLAGKDAKKAAKKAKKERKRAEVRGTKNARKRADQAQKKAAAAAEDADKAAKKVDEKIAKANTPKPPPPAPVAKGKEQKAAYVAAGFDYKQGGDDWQMGECLGGTMQSPVDIDTTQTVSEQAPIMSFHYKPVEGADLVFDGLKVKVAGDFGYVTNNGEKYLARHIQFHAPAEHHIDGKSSDMEMQIIHQKEGTAKVGGLLVVSVLFNSGKQSDLLMNLEWAHLPNKAGGTHKVSGKIDLMKDIKSSLEGQFFAYEGSMQMPPCHEGAQWRVMKTPQEMLAESATIYRKVFSEHPEVFADGQGNNRAVQPLNDRDVFVGTVSEGGETTPASPKPKQDAKKDAKQTDKAKDTTSKDTASKDAKPKASAKKDAPAPASSGAAPAAKSAAPAKQADATPEKAAEPAPAAASKPPTPAPPAAKKA